MAAATSLLAELDGWQQLGEPVSTDDLIAALERGEVTLASPAEPGRVPLLDLLRARTRRFRAVFLLGLEEGSLPRRSRASAFLDDERRRELGGRLERPDPVSRDRYFFYTACTRATERLYLVREAANDDGSPREPSPFWDEVAGVFNLDDVRHTTRRRALSELTWQIDAAPTERERLRALCPAGGRHRRSRRRERRRAADANGWTRRLLRAQRASERRTRCATRRCSRSSAPGGSSPATELERFADCSSAWLFERVIDPKTIDAEADALGCAARWRTKPRTRSTTGCLRSSGPSA